MCLSTLCPLAPRAAALICACGTPTCKRFSATLESKNILHPFRLRERHCVGSCPPQTCIQQLHISHLYVYPTSACGFTPQSFAAETVQVHCANTMLTWWDREVPVPTGFHKRCLHPSVEEQVAGRTVIPVFPGLGQLIASAEPFFHDSISNPCP